MSRQHARSIGTWRGLYAGESRVTIEHTKLVEDFTHCSPGGAGWREASALNDQMNKLEDQARDKGWRGWGDPGYVTLDDMHAFERADGPSSVIAYLETLLRRLDEGRDRSHNGEQQ